MNEETTEIAKTLDHLLARSWAQEAILFSLVKKATAENWTWALDAQQHAEQLKDFLRFSPLSDRQIALFDLEMTTLLERLERLSADGQAWPRPAIS